MFKPIAIFDTDSDTSHDEPISFSKNPIEAFLDLTTIINETGAVAYDNLFSSLSESTRADRPAPDRGSLRQWTEHRYPKHHGNTSKQVTSQAMLSLYAKTVPAEIYNTVRADTDSNKALAELVTKHFKLELGLKKLSSDPIGEWEKELGDFLNMATNNLCKEKHIGMFCKLPLFFLTNVSVQGLTTDDHFSRIKVGADDLRDAVVALKPISFIKHHERHLKDSSVLYCDMIVGDTLQIVRVITPKTDYDTIIAEQWVDFRSVRVNKAHYSYNCDMHEIKRFTVM
jgi:hypothetical protein|tara:strand:- start:12038 stop:12889 length:852 start_codon:yes stop_codon:yes gene_type:complete